MSNVYTRCVAFKQASDDLDIERRSDTELTRGFRLVRGYYREYLARSAYTTLLDCRIGMMGLFMTVNTPARRRTVSYSSINIAH